MQEIDPEITKLRQKVVRLGAAAQASHHPDIKLAFEIARTKLEERANELEAQLAAGEAAAG
jgi:hypothetical protein